MKGFPSLTLLLFAIVSGLAACQKQSGDIQASGTIEATSGQVSARSSGQIVRLIGEEGMSVRPGDLLAEVDHSTLDIQLSQARSGVDLARAQLDLLVHGARELRAQEGDQLFKPFVLAHPRIMNRSRAGAG